MSQRKIIHIDMDAFFASVEQHDDPSLCGLPLAVGFDGPRGVVSTASYEARQYSVHSAMPIATAKRRCPQLRIVTPRFDRYKEISGRVHRIFLDYTDLVEPLSIDEAFLDVTENRRGVALATDVAREIKQRITEETGLTASAGVSYNKFLAKIASDYRKPDGLFVIHPTKAQGFIDSLRIEQFWGVGPKTAVRMHQMGIFTGAQLRRVSRQHLVQVFGKAGHIYYDFARGIDLRPVVTDHDRKSVGCEQTFLEDLRLSSAILIELYHLVLELERRIAKSGFLGHTLTLKMKWGDMTQVTRSLTQPAAIQTKDDILPLAKRLLRQTEYKTRSVRLMGVAVSNPQGGEGEAVRPQWVEGFLPFQEWEMEEYPYGK
jgi:DNA polymerase IV